jgi:hypothetical protein
MLETFKKIHNFGLMMFSGYVAWNIYSELQPAYFVILPLEHFKSDVLTSTLNSVSWLFVYSKTYEFFDTWVLLARGIKPIFLQEYHHFGAVIMWHMFMQHLTSELVIATYYNSVIHTMMYCYYLLCCFKVKIPGFFKQFITSAQLIQLSVGLIYITIKSNEKIDELWTPQMITTIYGILYTIGLIILFCKFYLSSYINKSKNKKEI